MTRAPDLPARIGFRAPARAWCRRGARIPEVLLASALWLLVPALGLATGPEAVDAARAALAAGEIARAESLLAARLAAEPTDVAALRVRAEVQSRSGRYREAFASLRLGLGQKPGDPGLVGALKELRRPLVRELRAALANDPGNLDARHSLAFLLLLEQKREKGRSELERLAAAAPSYPQAWTDLAWIRALDGDLEAASEAVSKAFQSDPASPLVRRFLSVVRTWRQEPGTQDDFYGLLPVGAPAAPGHVSAPAATTGGPGPIRTGPDLAFGTLDLDDDTLVASLLRRIETDTRSQTAAPVSTGVATPEARPRIEDPSAQLVPTPLEVLKKLQDSYEAGRAHLEAHRFEAAEKALALVVSVRKGYKDAEALLEKAERGAQQMDRLAQALLLLDAGDGRAAGGILSSLDRTLVQKARPDLDLEALQADAAYLAGEWSRAESGYLKAIPRLPKDRERRYRLVMALAHQKKADEALEALSLLEAVAPGHAAAQPGFGRIRMELLLRRHFVWVALLAGLWIFLVVGYLAFFHRRRTLADATTSYQDELLAALRAGNPERILEAAAGLEKVARDQEQRGRAAAARIQALAALGKTGDASEALERFKREFPRDPAWKVLTGRVALAEGRVDAERLPYLRELLAAEPGHRGLLDLLHGWYSEHGDLGDDAREVLRRLLDLVPDDPALLVRECEFLEARRDFSDAALVHFQRTLTQDPKALVALRGRAVHFSQKGAHLDALGAAKEALAQAPSDRESRDVLVHAFKNLGLFQEGMRELDRLAERTGDPAAFADAKEELERLAREAETKVLSERAEEKELGGTYDRGVRLFSEGRFAEAVPLLRSAAAGESYRKHAGALVVKSHLALGEVEKAHRAFQDLGVEEVPADEFMVGLCYDMAVALETRGDYRAASDLLRRVCRADVDYRDAFARFEELQQQIGLSE